jgi:Tfp pilus assembly protein PilN
MKAVNLLPPDLRSGPVAPGATAGAEAPGGSGAYIVLGALALAVVALAVHVLGANTVKQRQADLAAATARAQVASREVTALKPYADYDAVTKARVETVKDLAGQRFRWDRALHDLSRAVPADVTLAQLGATVSATSTGATGGSQLRSALDVPAVELQGCTSGQTDVARLLSRLRTVTGVTRVTLTKSDKDERTERPQGTATDSEAAAPATTDAGACGTGDRPSFDVIAFFGSAGTTAGAAAPTAGTAGSTTAAAGAAAGATAASGSGPATTADTSATTAATGAAK